MALEKISIIIPMYNCEKYIKRCLDSLVNQTYKNMEIIVINDGSKDSSGEIVQTYVKKYSNVKLINKKNAGVSSARNLGIKESTGKYVAFVDSDDWCEKQMYSEMMKLTEKIDCDIICSGYKIDSYNGKVISEIKLNEVLLGKCEEEKSEVLHELGISYCFARLFKREIINKNNIINHTVIAVGDNMNDLELLEEADYGFCTLNGSEKLKKLSKYIACSNDDNVMEFLIKWIEKEKIFSN